METERWDEYEYERLQPSTYMTYESYAYWKLVIERMTLNVIVVIIYFVLSSWRRLKQWRKRDTTIASYVCPASLFLPLPVVF